MCCRYYVELSPELRPIIEAADHSRLRQGMVDKLGKKFTGKGEVRPTDMVAVIAPDREGRKKSYPMVWGFKVPGIRGPVVNARSESVHLKATFKESWERRRCIVPASYYYEWKHYEENGRVKTGDRYAIQPAGSNVTWLAGIYRLEEGYMGFRYPVFTILTREPSPEMRKIHDRMPVILPEDAMEDWINPNSESRTVRTIVRDSLTGMVVEKS